MSLAMDKARAASVLDSNRKKGARAYICLCLAFLLVHFHCISCMPGPRCSTATLLSVLSVLLCELCFPSPHHPLLGVLPFPPSLFTPSCLFLLQRSHFVSSVFPGLSEVPTRGFMCATCSIEKRVERQGDEEPRDKQISQGQIMATSSGVI